MARDILLRTQPRMLIVDKVRHLLAGGHREQRASLNLLKYLANDLKISIVAVGTSESPVAFQSDSQIYSRFAPFEIPRWTESEEFRSLLSAFEAALPLRRSSDLTQRPIVQFLIAAREAVQSGVAKFSWVCRSSLCHFLRSNAAYSEGGLFVIADYAFECIYYVIELRPEVSTFGHVYGVGATRLAGRSLFF